MLCTCCGALSIKRLICIWHTQVIHVGVAKRRYDTARNLWIFIIYVAAGKHLKVSCLDPPKMRWCSFWTKIKQSHRKSFFRNFLLEWCVLHWIDTFSVLSIKLCNVSSLQGYKTYIIPYDYRIQIAFGNSVIYLWLMTKYKHYFYNIEKERLSLNILDTNMYVVRIFLHFFNNSLIL